MRYRKIACYNFEFATRDEREIDVVKNYTDDVAIIAADGIHANTKTNSGVPIVRVREKSGGNKLTHYLKNMLLWRKAVNAESADVLSCHDLKALLIGYLSIFGKRSKPTLVYDAHEFEIGRNSDLSKNELLTAIKVHLERFLMRRCAFTIVVNDSIADEMARVHGLSERPVVARSTPYLWQRDEAAVRAARESFCSELGVGPDEAFIVMYHGAVVRGRGVEQVLEAAALVPQAGCVVLGDASPSYLDELRALAEGLGIEGRVAFRPAVPHEGLEACVAAADVGMVTCQAVSRSYYLMLPNKFFENVQAETPIVASDFPETSRLVERYGIGLTCDPSDVAQIASCIERLRTDEALYGECKINMKTVKRELCWEKEKAVLDDAYRGVFSQGILSAFFADRKSR